MPDAAMAVVDSLLKVLGGFALGFWARGVVGRRQPATGGKGKAAAAKGKPALIIPKPKEELKMVLCVNEALKMGKGKIGAQCAHAATGILQKYKTKHEVTFKQWEYHGQPKIALKLQDDDEMDELAQKASAAGLPTYIVCDAGRTQIPAGSQTVLAIGPAPKSQIDAITGHLRLL